VTFRPVSGSEKRFDASTDKKRGDSPNNAILAPEAMPRYLGNVFDAAKSDENSLILCEPFGCFGIKTYTHENTVPSPARKKKNVRL
jgi:hypothetical protein